MAGKQKYTNEFIHNEALKYKTRAEFQCNSKHYSTARYRKILDEVCSHMEKRQYDKKISDKDIHTEALKYDSRGEFQKESNSYYFLAYERKILDEVCSHMGKIRTTWNNESAINEALKYKTLKDFSINSASAYQYVLRNNIKEEACYHFPKQFRWTIEEVNKEALKYTYRNDFQKNSLGAYKWAYKNKKLDEVCSHMKNRKITPRGRFTYEGRNTILYYIKVNNVYKIGITIHEQYKNTRDSILKKRFGKDIKNGVNIEIIDHILVNNGEFAFDIENTILMENFENKYEGEKMLLGGNSEMFNENIYYNIKHYFKEGYFEHFL